MKYHLDLELMYEVQILSSHSSCHQFLGHILATSNRRDVAGLENAPIESLVQMYILLGH